MCDNIKCHNDRLVWRDITNWNPVTISAFGMLVPALSVKLFGSKEVPSGIRSVKITFVALFPLFVIVTGRQYLAQCQP